MTSDAPSLDIVTDDAIAELREARFTDPGAISRAWAPAPAAASAVRIPVCSSSLPTTPHAGP